MIPNNQLIDLLSLCVKYFLFYRLSYFLLSSVHINSMQKQIRLLTRQLQGLLSEQKEATTSTSSSTSSSYSSSSSNNNSNDNNRNRNNENMNNNNSNNRYDDSQSRSQSQSQSQSGYQAPPPSSPYTSRSDRAIINASNVEDELVKLKKKMGLK